MTRRRAIHLGHSINKRRGSLEVWLADADRSSGLYIAGATRTGKSTLILNMVVQDMDAGHGVLVLAPDGDLIEDILRRVPNWRMEDVIYWNLSDGSRPFGLNIYEAQGVPGSLENARAAEQSVDIFKKMWPDSWGQQLEDNLRAVAYTLLDAGMTMAEIPLLLRHGEFREALIARLENPVTRDFWYSEYNPMSRRDQLEYTRSTMVRIRALLSNPNLFFTVAQGQSAIDWRLAMDTGKIVLGSIPAGELSDTNASLLGSIIISRVFTAALSRKDTAKDERYQFCLYVDEFHRFATPDFAKLLVEVGKYGVVTCVSHQHRSQLSYEMKGATMGMANMVVFRVNPEDAQELSGKFQADVAPRRMIPEMRMKQSRDGKTHVPQTTSAYDHVGYIHSSSAYDMVPEPRSRAEIEREMASELANQSNRAARYRILRDGSIEEDWLFPEPPVPESLSQGDMLLLKLRSKTLYGKDKEEIEEEIRSRRNQLFQAPVAEPEEDEEYVREVVAKQEPSSPFPVAKRRT